MRGFFVVVGIAAAGCYQPSVTPGLPCAANGACPTGLECIAGSCELPGGGGDAHGDGMSDAMIDACATATCSGDDLVGCGPVMTCATGCESAGGAHCRELVPSNGVTTTLLSSATASIGAGENWSFNADTGQIKKGNITLRAAGTGVIGGINFQIIDGMGVFAARSFTVGGADTWEGNGSNALVLYAATTIDVIGTIDVGANGSSAGPGGSDGASVMTGFNCRGRAGRFFSSGFGEGGGGGGGRSAGGDGGNSNMGASAGLGGIQCATQVLTIPLRGGTGGGHGGASTLNAGGGGGGAIALVAMVSINIAGTVGAPGEGGDVGTPGTAPSGDGGGGGGSGGAILLEAPFVTVTGSVTANGGSGAAPAVNDGLRGSMNSSTQVNGGSFTGPGGTRTGGRGGTNSGPGSGQTYQEDDGLVPPTVIITRGAGGGGAGGRTEVKSLTHTFTGATFSPGTQTTDATLQ